jgi:homoserine/homoserine lactone efflux protein
LISFSLYPAFILASTALLLIPGPNVALIASNSIAHGSRAGFVTVMGTSSAMVAQLTIAVFGMTALLGISAEWFSGLRWIGVVYLFYLGIRAFRAAPADSSAHSGVKPDMLAMFWRGILISLTNPKTLLFFGAFLPQFVSPAYPSLPQLLMLSASFLVLAVIIDSAWALFAGRLRPFLRPNGRWRNRLQGGLLIGAAAGLGLARKT